MELDGLRCFLVVADELHFGRAALKLALQPAVLGRRVRALEADLGVRLFARTTRSVALTSEGAELEREARDILSCLDTLRESFRARGRAQAARRFRIGAIDSAAGGLLPELLGDLRRVHPEFAVRVHEDKTIRLLPKLLSGAIDLAFIRPPERADRRVEIRPLFFEAAVVAMPANHPLAGREFVTLADIAGEPLIVPERSSRPHSHDLTMKLFAGAGLVPRVAEIADEKQTIVTLVAAGLGLAVVPRWTRRLGPPGVSFVPLCDADGRGIGRLPLAAAWLGGVRDGMREEILAVLFRNANKYRDMP